MLPNLVSTLITFLALHSCGRVPAMLNFSAGAQGMANACVTAGIRTVYTSSRFVERARLQGAVAHLGNQVRILYLEDLRRTVTYSG